jgi:hypothetical protein
MWRQRLRCGRARSRGQVELNHTLVPRRTSRKTPHHPDERGTHRRHTASDRQLGRVCAHRRTRWHEHAHMHAHIHARNTCAHFAGWAELGRLRDTTPGYRLAGARRPPPRTRGGPSTRGPRLTKELVTGGQAPRTHEETHHAGWPGFQVLGIYSSAQG